jgi:hypothetical protein
MLMNCAEIEKRTVTTIRIARTLLDTMLWFFKDTTI